MNKYLKYFVLGLVLLLTSCASFYEWNSQFNKSFERGDIAAAEKALKENKRAIKRKSKFLFLVNKGVVSFMQGEYEKSNKIFERAYLFGEDFRKKHGQEFASFLTNPNVTDYPGEEHEHLMVLYYKALNYLNLGDNEAALVECRRLNNRLIVLNDEYENKKRADERYKNDAFIHNLMGLIYEANGEVNNAFIAYRNAYDAYNSDYKHLFNLQTPEQLKIDLMRTAYLNGFDSDLMFYEDKFNQVYKHKPSKNGELIFFWHNGLAPYKDEVSVNFTLVEDGIGGVTFINDDYGFDFPFQWNAVADNERDGIKELEFLRIVFPKYVEREPRFNRADIVIDSLTYSFEIAEDINGIAFQVLKQRMFKEMSKALIRAAAKKAIEKKAEDISDEWWVGLLVNAVNTITEQADTRNWQSLPHSIYYTRIPLKPGTNEINMNIFDRSGGKAVQTFYFNGQPGMINFHAYQSF